MTNQLDHHQQHDLQQHEKNAAERNYSDINFQTYLLSTFGLCAIRCAILHPLFIVVARKQICSETGKKSFLQIVREMRVREGGAVRAFTQGMFMMTAGMAVSETTFNGAYEFGRFYLQDSLQFSMSSSTAGGAWVADWASRILFSPFNVVAIRQMTYNCSGVSHHTLKFQNNTARHIVQESFRMSGFRSFFSGIGLVLCVGSFNSSVFFTAYVTSKSLAYSNFGPWFADHDKRVAAMEKPTFADRVVAFLPASCSCSKDNFLLNSGASFIGSSLASILVNPYYVVLGKVQSGVAKNTKEAVQMVLKSPGGPRNFFRGALSGAAATMFDCWLASSTYEMAMKLGMNV